jgi:hypothetical protein
MSVRRALVAGSAACVLALLSTAAAQAAGGLSAGHASVGVSNCNTALGGCSFQTATPLARDLHVDFNTSLVSANVSTASFGTASASVNPGAGGFDLPQLHSYVSGGAVGSIAAFNYSAVQGIQRYEWTGTTGIDIGFADFVGTLEFDRSGNNFGGARASLAIINGDLFGNRPLLDQYFQGDGEFSAANCGTSGAIAIRNIGFNTTVGHTSSDVLPGGCSGTSFHLNSGDQFFVWAKLLTYQIGDGVTDASHTFSVHISPQASPQIVEALTQNLEAAPEGGFGVPEPSTWALMIGGFGLTGAMLRRRRQVAT